MKYTSIGVLILLLGFASFTRAQAQEVEDELEFSYNVESEIGPEHWGEIRPEWRDCNSGRMQSPIDLLDRRVEIVSHLNRLEIDYRPANATLVNRGHDMMLRWTDDAGHIHINGTEFHLRQCHWHSPSEHTINGKRFHLEVHLVHESDDNRTAVIGILYNWGQQPDPLLSMMRPNLVELSDTRHVEKNVGVVNPMVLNFGNGTYYRYIGSLTTPPCSQNIIWTIEEKVKTVTKEQVLLIRDAVHDESANNARPTQPINDRKIEFYKPRDTEK